MTDLLTITVRGEEFTAPKEVLCRSDLIKHEFMRVNSKEGITLDKSPIIFKHILETLYDSKYPFPVAYTEELKTYLIPESKVTIYDPEKKTEKKILDRLATIEASIQHLQTSINKCNSHIADTEATITKLHSVLLEFTCLCLECDATVIFDSDREGRYCKVHRICLAHKRDKKIKCSTLCVFGKKYCDKHKYFDWS